MEINVYKIKDKLPKDGQSCWVCHYVGGKYSSPVCQVYNKYHEEWDDAKGEFYDFDVTDEDLWMPLPSVKEMENEYNAR